MSVVKPIIAITMGDPAGIGPEIAVKAMIAEHIRAICRPLIIGDAGVIRHTVDLLGMSLQVRNLHDVSEFSYVNDTIEVFDLENVDFKHLIPGKVSKMAGAAAFESVREAIVLAMADKVDATVTGPINKESINLAGHHFSGHTEIYAHFTGTKKYAMLLVHENLRVIHVSTHVSLREACDLVRKKRIVEVIQLLNDACKDLGIAHPKIGVAGLNPHASDGGLFGDEEEKEIIPAIETTRKQGYLVDGPVPADTLFAKAAGGLFDGCVAMYHDQGHIPFKVKGFIWDEENRRMKSVQGVNITLGLPIIRTSVDHGTAFEIAGKGVASPDAMILAVEYATKMAINRLS